MSAENREDLARKFLSILGSSDADVVKTVAVEDTTWTFPGTSPEPPRVRRRPFGLSQAAMAGSSSIA
jgi:hypothetical protein